MRLRLKTLREDLTLAGIPMFSAIVSSQNPRVKSAAALRESRARRREGLFLVDGFREVLRAWRSSFEFVEVFWNAGLHVSPDEKVNVEAALDEVGFPADRLADFCQMLKEVDASGVSVVPLSSNAFEKISFGERNEGVVAVVRSKTYSLSALDAALAKRREETGDEPLVAVIEGVEKPGNLGAILRSADGAGVDALIVVASDYDVFNPNAVRGSLGAIFHIPIVVVPCAEALAWLRERGLQRVTALCDESISYLQPDYRRPTAIILGSEADGLTPPWSEETSEDAQNHALQRIRLPMLGVADSLNVSNAAAILFYEARRVRSYSAK